MSADYVTDRNCEECDCCHFHYYLRNVTFTGKQFLCQNCAPKENPDSPLLFRKTDRYY